MKFGSIGTRAASRLMRRTDENKQAGFTLLEALVALTLVLAFASVLGPLMFQARRIIINADGRVAAQILLRALLQDPLDRASLANLLHEGETEGLQWQITAEPAAIAARFPPHAPLSQTPTTAQPSEPPTQWEAYRVSASVTWAPGQVVSAETVRLGKSE